VDVGRGEEGVDALLGGVLDGLVAAVNVLLRGPREARDGHRLRAAPVQLGANLAGDDGDGLEVARGGDGEAGLADVDAEAGQLVGDRDLLVHLEGAAARGRGRGQGGKMRAEGRARAQSQRALCIHP
jgi:hypothetical protein